MNQTRFVKFLLPLWLFSGSILLPSCEKEGSGVTGVVELYLLKSHETLDAWGGIDSASVVPEEEPLIAYSEFTSYDPENHVFTITESARAAVSNLEVPVQGIPFAVEADGTPVYTGYFWPAYSSQSCQWIVVDPVRVSFSNEMKVELGYPGLFEGFRIPDQRNHPLILNIFRRDGKLVE